MTPCTIISCGLLVALVLNIDCAQSVPRARSGNTAHLHGQRALTKPPRHTQPPSIEMKQAPVHGASAPVKKAATTIKPSHVAAAPVKRASKTLAPSHAAAANSSPSDTLAPSANSASGSIKAKEAPSTEGRLKHVIQKAAVETAAIETAALKKQAVLQKEIVASHKKAQLLDSELKRVEANAAITSAAIEEAAMKSQALLREELAAANVTTNETVMLKELATTSILLKHSRESERRLHKELRTVVQKAAMETAAIEKAAIDTQAILGQEISNANLSANATAMLKELAQSKYELIRARKVQDGLHTQLRAVVERAAVESAAIEQAALEKQSRLGQALMMAHIKEQKLRKTLSTVIATAAVESAAIEQAAASSVKKTLDASFAAANMTSDASVLAKKLAEANMQLAAAQAAESVLRKELKLVMEKSAVESAAIEQAAIISQVELRKQLSASRAAEKKLQKELQTVLKLAAIESAAIEQAALNSEALLQERFRITNSTATNKEVVDELAKANRALVTSQAGYKKLHAELKNVVSAAAVETAAIEKAALATQEVLGQELAAANRTTNETALLRELASTKIELAHTRSVEQTLRAELTSVKQKAAVETAAIEKAALKTQALLKLDKEKLRKELDNTITRAAVQSAAIEKAAAKSQSKLQVKLGSKRTASSKKLQGELDDSKDVEKELAHAVDVSASTRKQLMAQLARSRDEEKKIKTSLKVLQASMKELKSGAKLLKHQGVINRLSATNTGAAPAAGIADCRIGDIIKAMWAGKGKQMSATVQKVGADSITVNWHDGTSSHRTFPKARAFKDGQPCAAPTLAAHKKYPKAHGTVRVDTGFFIQHMLPQMEVSSKLKHQPHLLFARFDTDHDGVLDEDEERAAQTLFRGHEA